MTSIEGIILNINAIPFDKLVVPLLKLIFVCSTFNVHLMGEGINTLFIFNIHLMGEVVNTLFTVPNMCTPQRRPGRDKSVISTEPDVIYVSNPC